MSQFQEEQFLANMVLLLEKCVKEDLDRDAINKINALTVGYVANSKRSSVDKKCEDHQGMVKRSGRLGGTYDKGTGFCLMKKNLQ